MASVVKKLKLNVHTTRTYAFTPEENELLVELVSQNPALYDIRLESYKDGAKKDKIWNDIGNALNKSGDDCKKRWRHTKDAYNRVKRKQRLGRKRTHGSKSSRWKLYEKLNFLEAITGDTLNSEDNVNEESNSEEEKDFQFIQTVNDIENESIMSMEIKTEDISTQIIDPHEERKPIYVEKSTLEGERETKQDELLQYMKKRDERRQILHRTVEENVERRSDETNVESFGEHVKSVLRQLPPILRVRAKSEIFNVISKYELMSMEMPSSTTSTSSTSNFSYVVPYPVSPSYLDEANEF